jgi:hypothetical protein
MLNTSDASSKNKENVAVVETGKAYNMLRSFSLFLSSSLSNFRKTEAKASNVNSLSEKDIEDYRAEYEKVRGFKGPILRLKIFICISRIRFGSRCAPKIILTVEFHPFHHLIHLRFKRT